MKVYLVGGAVRDQLLSLPVKERDWVVVGATPEELLELGYQKVGKDFPVFLHPKTREEYALARTERKSAPGYYGFQCTFDHIVTLEEDLKRRDLTINAMARDEHDELVDPYHGFQDLINKKLRHVSPAFQEDPVRVLRIARFAARYHELGFSVADETRLLMYNMVKNGELAHLVPERVWQEWQRSLTEDNPAVFIQVLRNCGALQVTLPEIDALFGVPNPRQYHLEVDSGVHSLQALQAAVSLTSDPSVRFASLLHDLGKALTPMNQWPKHYKHEERAVMPILSLCQRLRIPSDYRDFAIMCSRLHLIIHRVFEMRANTIVKTLARADAFRRPNLFNNLLIVCQSDAMACGRETDYPQRKAWQAILALCKEVKAQRYVLEGKTGAAIQEAMYAERIELVKQFIKKWKEE